VTAASTVSGRCSVTTTLMTYDKQSNGRRIEVESTSNRICKRRLTQTHEAILTTCTPPLRRHRRAHPKSGTFWSTGVILAGYHFLTPQKSGSWRLLSRSRSRRSQWHSNPGSLGWSPAP